MENQLMDIMDIIRERRSVRVYQGTMVPDEILSEILDAARLAPSARNSQQWRFIAVKDSEQLQRVAETTGQAFVGRAPVIIAGVSLDTNYIMRCGVPAYAVDLAIAMNNIALVATARGLGTCWIGSFNQEAVKKVLGIPEECKVVELMTLGYPADQPGRKNRKGFEEVVSYDRF